MANLAVGTDALRIHPMRTLLSVLGITIGSAALVATMAVSDGMMAFVRARVLRETSVQVVVIAPRTSAYRDGQWTPVFDYPIFTLADAEIMREQLGRATAVSMVLGGRADVRLRHVQHSASLVLGTAGLLDFGSQELGVGRFFTETEVANNVPVVVLNHALARELAPSRDPFALVGRDIHVRGHLRRVIGVLAPADFEDDRNPSFTLYAPIRAASALLGAPPRGRFAPSIQLRASTVESVEPLRDDVYDFLARRYGRWDERVEVTVGLEQLRIIEQGFLLMKLFIGALVGISLLVGGIGVMNVLLASVAERTREIGIRKSVGARRRDIHAQFLTESVLIALAGAAAGLVLGFAIAAGVAAFFRQFAGTPIYPALSPAAVLVPTLSSSIVGLLFGTYPARRAASLPPVVAIGVE